MIEQMLMNLIDYPDIHREPTEEELRDIELEEICKKYATPMQWTEILKDFRLGTNDHKIGWCD